MKTKIIFEDDDIIVCHKAAGLPVQARKSGVMDMESELKGYLKRKCGDSYLGVVHRLDQPVEGIMVFAKNREAAGFLSNRISKKNDDSPVNKYYEAVVYGHMSQETGELRDSIIEDAKSNSSHIGTGEGAKDALLSYKRIASDEYTDTLLISLYTGRHHQIRLQLHNNGTPIIGDRKYYSEASLEYSEKNSIRNVALKAVRLEIVHPKTMKNMKFALSGYEDESVL